MVNSSIRRLVKLSRQQQLRPLLPLVSVLLVLLLVACGGGSSTNQTSSTTVKKGGNIVVGLDSDVVTLDPLNSSALVDREVMLNIYDTLVKVNAQNEIEPDLATSWQYKSPTQLVFTLRTDVKFQDGTPFNADAVVFNINRILTTPSSPRYSEISDVQSVTAIDSSHVQFNLKAPFSPLLAALTDRAGMMLSPTAVQKLGANLANAPTNAGSGPFEFVDWVKGDHLTSQRNQLPYLQSIRYRPITNGSVMFSNLETGNINVAEDIDPTDVAAAQSNPSLIYKQIPGLSFYGFMLNVKAAPLNNVHVRRAIEWAVNRQEIVTSVLKNVGTVAQGPIPPSSWAYDSSFAPYSYNINQAKAELAQAGDTKGVTFTMLIASGSPLNTQEAQFIQAELQPAGITMNIKQE